MEREVQRCEGAFLEKEVQRCEGLFYWSKNALHTTKLVYAVHVMMECVAFATLNWCFTMQEQKRASGQFGLHGSGSLYR